MDHILAIHGTFVSVGWVVDKDAFVKWQKGTRTLHVVLVVNNPCVMDGAAEEVMAQQKSERPVPDLLLAYETLLVECLHSPANTLNCAGANCKNPVSQPSSFFF